MKKITISTSLAVLLLLTPTLPTNLKAEWYNPATWSDSKEELRPITFDLLYPTPFYKTGVFKWTAIVVVSAGVAVATVATGGVAGVPGATLIGGLIGGGGAGAWAAGLATLGGGTLVSGGLGMAGGAVLVATMTDVTIAGLSSFALPENKVEGHKYNTLKIPLPKVGSNQTLATFKLIDELTEKYMDGDIKIDLYDEQSYSYYKYALNNLNINESPYDLINGAILAYNLGKFDVSADYLHKAYIAFPTSSFISYQKALLNLVDNKVASAIDYLNFTINREPTALTPYLLKAQLELDEKQLDEAIKTVDMGLKEYDDDNFQLNYFGGIISYRQGKYKTAIDYFKEALANITVNEIEAETKMLIAKCYKKATNSEKADKWYKDAMSEVDDNKGYQAKLNTMYYED